MVDCITICNSACITCIWCILFSVWYELVIIVDRKPSDKNMLTHVCSACFFGKVISFFLSFPRFSKNLRKVDSSECCVRRKPMQKHRRAHDLPRCVRTGSVHARRKFKDPPCVKCNREDQQESRSCHREKICTRLGECRNVHQCMEKNKKTSQICSRQIEHSNNYNKSDDSLNKKYSINADLKANKSEYHVCKRS